MYLGRKKYASVKIRLSISIRIAIFSAEISEGIRFWRKPSNKCACVSTPGIWTQITGEYTLSWFV